MQGEQQSPQRPRPRASTTLPRYDAHPLSLDVVAVTADGREAHLDAATDVVETLAPRVVRSLKRTVEYQAYAPIRGLAIIELGNRGITCYFYLPCWWGPSPECTYRSYYRKYGEAEWVAETSSDPFVSAYSAHVLSSFLLAWQHQSLQ